MNGIGSGDLAGINDLVPAEVGLGRRGGSNEDRLVGHPDGQGVLITVFLFFAKRIDSNKSGE